MKLNIELDDNLMETEINLSDLNAKGAVIKEALKLFIFTKKQCNLDLLFGSWSDKEYNKFEKSQSDFKQIDNDM